MRITVFNVGRGASVLVELPPTPSNPSPVGIIDCFAGPNDEAPLMRRLETIDLESDGKLSIEFFVLTHLHADHFFGIGDLISKYERRIRKILDPGIDPRKVMAADFNTKATHDKRAQRELKQLARFKQRYRYLVQPLTAPGLEIYRDDANNVTVRSLAPEGTMLSGIERVLETQISEMKSALREDKEMPNIGRSYDLNRTSSAIELNYQGYKVVLGGDVLNATWNIVMNNHVRLDSDVFLLGHHGASNAFPQKLWDTLKTPNGHTIISGRGRGQPAPSVINFLRKHNNGRVWITNLPETYPDRLFSYVASVHYGVKTAKPRAGKVVCSLGGELAVEGPRLI